MIGTTLNGQFRIDRLLGEGASGTVFAGWDLMLDQPRAIKMLNRVSADEKASNRFLEEARTLATFDHPNVVRVYSCGFHEHIPYIVMEFLEGKPLGDVLHDRRPSLREGLGIMSQVASGLAAIHARSIIHHDVKPNNILVTTSGHVKLLDLGLAKNITHNPTVTSDGYLVGTIAYVSPEQIDNRGTTVASEIFSFGVVLYEVVAGVHPFMAEHYMSVLYNIAQKDPLPLENCLENPPTALVTLVNSCLAREPTDRPPDMEYVAKALRRIEESADLDSSSQRLPSDPISDGRPTAPHNPYHNRVMIRRREDFIGRRQEVRRIYARLNATPPGSVSLVGDRKIGKSSLLNFIYEKHNRESYLQRPEKMIMIFLDLQQQRDKALETFTNTLLGMMQLELRGRLDFSSMSRDLDGVLAAVQLLHDRGYRLTVLLDEFEIITANPRFDLDFFSFLRHLANHYNVAYLTSSRRDLQILCYDKEIASSPFFNIFTTMRLSAFSSEEAEELVRIPSAQAGHPLEPFRADLIRIAGYFPFFLQLACAHAFEFFEECPGATQPDFKKIERLFYQEAVLHFRYLWANFDNYEKSLIQRVAKGKGIPGALEHVLQELSERHLVEEGNGKPRLFCPSFEEFVTHEISSRTKISILGKLFGRG